MSTTDKVKRFVIVVTMGIVVSSCVSTPEQHSQTGPQKTTAMQEKSDQKTDVTREKSGNKTDIKNYPDQEFNAEAEKRRKKFGGPIQINSVDEVPSYRGNRSYKVVDGIDEYRCGPGDVLTITEWRSGGVMINRDITVRPDGMASYFFIENMPVTGLSPVEIDDLITNNLKGYVKEPTLDVRVRYHRSKIVSLFGEIKVIGTRVDSGPGHYPLKGSTKALEIIMRHGSITERADLKKVELTRGGKTYALNLLKVLKEGDESNNVLLEAGDMLLVPLLPQFGTVQVTENRIYIFGEVQTPGIYTFGETATIVDAISKSGGIKPNGSMNKIRIVRGNPENPTVIPVKLKKIFMRKPDLTQKVRLNDLDIVYVGTSTFGKVNTFLTKLGPIFGVMQQPAAFRENYTTGGGLRMETDVSERALAEQGRLGGFAGAAAQ